MKIEIAIQICDEDLAAELIQLDLSGVTVLTRLRAAVTPDNLSSFVIGLGSGMAVNLFSSWVYDRLKRCKGTPEGEKIAAELAKITARLEKIENYQKHKSAED